MLALLFAAQRSLLYAVIYPSALSAPSATQVKQGKDSGGGAAVWSGATAAPLTTGTFNWPSSATGLTSGTSYRIAFVWNSGALDSNVAVSDPWVTLSNSYSLALDAGSYSLSGQDVTLTYLPAGGTAYSLSLDAGSYLLSGQDVGLTSARRIALDTGTYSLTGYDVTFRVTLSIPLDTGVYTLNGQPVTLTWSGAPPVVTPTDTIITLRSLTERWRM